MKLQTAVSLPPGKKRMVKTLRIMKLIAVFLLAGCLQVSANGFSQTITLSEKKITLQKLFVKINRQTGYQFFYKDRLLDNAGKINIHVTNVPLSQVLEVCFKDLPLSYSITDKMVFPIILLMGADWGPVIYLLPVQWLSSRAKLQISR